MQGDEPIFPSDQLEIFIKNVIQDKTKVYTAITSIKDEKDYRNYSIPKNGIFKFKEIALFK